MLIRSALMSWLFPTLAAPALVLGWMFHVADTTDASPPRIDHRPYAGAFETAVKEIKGAISPDPEPTTFGTIRTENLLVDNETLASGHFQICPNVTGGCIGKPMLEFEPSTGILNLYTSGLPDNVFTSAFNILKVMNGATQPQQLQQTLISGTVDTTAGPTNVWAGEFGAEASKSAGAPILRNTALLVHAANGDENLAIDSLYGDWVQHDTASTFTNAGDTITGSLSIYVGAPGPVDFTNATAVMLGSALVSPVGIPGATNLNPQLYLGGSMGDGYQLVTRNTRNDIVGGLGGLQVLLDTTPDALARGGIGIHRAAGGGAGSNGKGFFVSGGTEFNPNLNANDLSIYNQEANKSIFFVTGGTGTTRTPLVLKNTAHIGMDGSSPVISACGAGPSAVTGPDSAFYFTTGAGAGACTITFSTTYGAKPVCTARAEGSAVIPTCTTSATAITCTTVAAATEYHWHCFFPGSSVL